jgi:dolichyl-phosphate beta-glucosyltransferase
VLHALASRPRMVGYWDADLATPLSVIPQFVEILATRPEVRVVLGSRVRLLGRTIHRRLSRHLLGRAFATAASLVLDLPVYDTQCGAKLFRATADVAAAFAEPLRSRWVFDVELLARLLRTWRSSGEPWPESALYEQPLPRWEDVAGSKLRLWDFPKSAWELASIYWCYRRPVPASARPTQTACPGQEDPAAIAPRRAA